jgi:hypothetical protein
VFSIANARSDHYFFKVIQFYSGIIIDTGEGDPVARLFDHLLEKFTDFPGMTVRG